MSDLDWRRIFISVLIAGGSFFLLFVLSSSAPLVAVLLGAVFLPVGVWLGRSSRRPWLEGGIYGVLSAVTAAIIILSTDFPLRTWAFGFAVLLAIPQGVLGTWLGARFFASRESQGGS